MKVNILTTHEEIYTECVHNIWSAFRETYLSTTANISILLNSAYTYPLGDTQNWDVA